MVGKLIIIESGTDGSGKATQTQELFNRLVKDGHNVKKVTYPNYGTPACATVEMYLKGAFGKDAESISPYTASTFYAIDRYASFKTEWEDFYNNGVIILADRYATSNMIHQASKMSNKSDIDDYLSWLYKLEFEENKIPVPDCVIFLDVPLEYSEKLMADRANKITGEAEKDIHESNREHLSKSYNTSQYIADKFNWNKIKCTENDKMRTIQSINDDIYNIVKDIL